MRGHSRGGRAVSRHGRSAPIIVLLVGILVALVVLIGVLVTQRGGYVSGPSPVRSGPVVADGQTVRRAELSHPPPSPKPVGDPDRIKETLLEGKTYRVVLKAGLNARAEDKAWWRKEVINLAYVVEMQVDRTVERNDGRRVVELRHFVTSRNVKLLCDVEDAAIDLGAPGVLLLGALAYLQPGAGLAVTAAKPVADAILRRGAQEAARGKATRAVAHVDTLSGKTVRITYVDGLGVESVEPVGCTLTRDERDFVAGTAVLSDCYIWDLRKAVGARWKVDGSQLSGLIDPSLRGTTDGEIHFVRDDDGKEDGRTFAALRVEGGSLMVNSSDASTRRVGTFSPRGTLRYSLTDKVVERATLVGRFDVEEVTTDHILFETSFKTRPTLTVEYACSVH